MVSGISVQNFKFIPIVYQKLPRVGWGGRGGGIFAPPPPPPPIQNRGTEKPIQNRVRMKKEGVTLVEGDVYVTLVQCNVFFFILCDSFRKWKTGLT